MRMASTQVSVSNYKILPRLASSLEACETSFSKCISVQAQPEYVRLCSAAHKKNFDKPNNMIWAQVEEASVNKHEMHDRHNYLNA